MEHTCRLSNSSFENSGLLPYAKGSRLYGSLLHREAITITKLALLSFGAGGFQPDALYPEHAPACFAARSNAKQLLHAFSVPARFLLRPL